MQLPSQLAKATLPFLTAVLTAIAFGTLVVVIVAICISLHSTFRVRHVSGRPWYEAFKLKQLCRPHSVNRDWLSNIRLYTDKQQTFRDYLLLSPVIHSIDPTDNVHIVSSPEFERPLGMKYALDVTIPGSLLTMSGDVHRQTRAKLRTKFSQDLLPNFHDSMGHALRELCSSLSSVSNGTPRVDPALAVEFPGDPFVTDIAESVSETTFHIICRVVLGTKLDAATRRLFSEKANQLMIQILFESIFYPFGIILNPLLTKFSSFSKNREAVNAICREILNQRMEIRKQAKVLSRKNNRDNEVKADSEEIVDLLDAIIYVHDYNPDAEATEAISQTLLFAIAGAHTTSSAISWVLFELALEENRGVLEQLYRELDDVCKDLKLGLDEMLPFDAISKLQYTKKVWKETLRLHPGTVGIPRKAVRDVMLRGSKTRIPKGTLVMACYWGSQTNERYFSNPHQFLPSRWGDFDNPGQADRAPVGAFLPFSGGPANCAGQFFAEYEGVCIIAEIYRRFRFVHPGPSAHIRSYSGWVEVPKYDPKDDGSATIGVPLRVVKRGLIQM